MKILSPMPHLIIQENVPLAPFTTLKVGGPARYFAEVRTKEELVEAVSFARKGGFPFFVLGEGSNLVIADEGFGGLVIKNDIRGFAHEIADGRVNVTVGAGEPWDDVVARCVKEGWAGLETLSGIPGTAGAAPVQNIGAYGQEARATIAGVEAFDVQKSRLVRFPNKKCGFGYRDSVFKSHPHTKRALSTSNANARSGVGAGPSRYCITKVIFSLVPGGVPHISSYPDIAAYFKGRQDIPSLAEVRKATIEIRARKGMVIMPEYESFMSVGSFFKNPVVPREIFLSAKEKSPVTERAWHWELPDGKVKISAAHLIEQAGFPKGCFQGNVGISPKHSLAIVNLGGATAKEIADFARAIRDAVMKKFGVRLEPEAQFVGFAKNPLD